MVFTDFAIFLKIRLLPAQSIIALFTTMIKHAKSAKILIMLIIIFVSIGRSVLTVFYYNKMKCLIISYFPKVLKNVWILKLLLIASIMCLIISCWTILLLKMTILCVLSAMMDICRFLILVKLSEKRIFLIREILLVIYLIEFYLFLSVFLRKLLKNLYMLLIRD